MSLQQLGLGQPLPVRVGHLEVQVDRHTSIFESEQGTRMRVSARVEKRMDEQDRRLVRIERAVYGVGVALAIVKFLLH